MELNLGREVAAMERMTVNGLRAKYAEVFGEPTNARHEQWLLRRIAWRLQANAEGELSERARKRAAELARDADLRLSPPKLKPVYADSARTVTARLPVSQHDRLPPPGTLLTRDYKGHTVRVEVLPDGFEYAGDVYRSLSAVAKAITGSHCNGYLFFRLGNYGSAK